MSLRWRIHLKSEIGTQRPRRRHEEHKSFLICNFHSIQTGVLCAPDSYRDFVSVVFHLLRELTITIIFLPSMKNYSLRADQTR